MKKKIAVLCIIGMICSMAACGGTTTETTTATAAPDTTTTTEATEETSADAAADTSAEDTVTEAEDTTATEATTAQDVETTTEAAAADTTATEYLLGGEDTVGYFLDEAQLKTIFGNSVLNEGNLARLAKTIKKAQDGGDVTISYIGGSITQGSTAGDQLCYAALTTDWFRTTFPNANIIYNRAGIGATGSYIGVHRVDEDVLANNPDLVFVEFSVNDTTEATERNQNSYDSLLRKIWNYKSAPAIICVCMTQEDGTSFQDYHAEIAKSYDLPIISYKNTILAAIKDGMFVWDTISDDNIHPNIQGHDLLTKIITSYLRDVTAKVSTVDTSKESDFSKAFTDNIYANAKRIGFTNSTPDEIVGFQGKDSLFGNIAGIWRVASDDKGVYADGSVIKYTVEARNIGILFGMQTKGGGTFEVKIDGETVKTVSEDFTGGWGNYVEAVEVTNFDTTGTHTVEIIPVTASAGTRETILISCLTVS